jgi:uncharacterized membrane protein YkvA (DUF1232 family)
MDTAHIEEMIDKAVAIEAKECHLAHYLEDRAQTRGLTLDAQQKRDALELFERYIRSVPTLLRSTSALAQGTPVEALLGQVIRAAVTYWDEPDDLVPDELGLLGLLDDAYFTLQSLQLVSERLQGLTGQALMADDLTALDNVVREILGELADVLDELVDLSMTNAGIEELLGKIAEYSGSFALTSAQTSFTGLSVVELVETHLSFATEPEDPLQTELVAVLEPYLAEIATRTDSSLVALGDGLARVRADIDRVLLAAEIDDERDRTAVAAMLTGALLAQLAAGAPLDRDFAERCVELILGGL